jgi:TPR repeat protein
MANREELGIIRGARGGNAAAQLELGKRYLFGSAGLPRSLPTALHWLDRAAQQGCDEAIDLIGAHVTIELASASPRPLVCWYERATDNGGVRAGIVFAQLVLADPLAALPLRAKALRALEAGAAAGFADALDLLAQHRRAAGATQPASRPPLAAVAAPPGLPLIDAAWQARDWPAYLALALPLARALVAASADPGRMRTRLAPGDVSLLSRCARLLDGGALDDPAAAGEVRHFWKLAADENDREAQLAVGLWWARMRLDGRRTATGNGSANFRKAIHWLALAGEQGLAEAWYALSRIYIKPEFSQRNVGMAQRYLERSASMGFREAQLECGNNAWRARRENESNDVRAVYWLQKAATQGCGEARAMLDRIAPREPGRLPARLAVSAAHPLLAARLELAEVFGLSRAEALLLDAAQADRGHCLVIDIRSSYGRSKRRLVMVETAAEREALDRIVKAFDGIDGGPGGPEGNYRQRLYRLKTVAPEACLDTEVESFDMAA